MKDFLRNCPQANATRLVDIGPSDGLVHLGNKWISIWYIGVHVAFVCTMEIWNSFVNKNSYLYIYVCLEMSLLSGVPDYFGRNKISSGGDLSHYSSASLY